MAVKPLLSLSTIACIFIFHCGLCIFPRVFLFRDVILSHGRFVFVFFLTPFDEGVVGKHGAACGNVTFGTAGRVVLAHSGFFFFAVVEHELHHENLSLCMCVCVCAGQVCLTKVRVLIVLHSPLLYCSHGATKAILWPLLFVLPVVSQLQARNSFQSLWTEPVWSSGTVDKSCGGNFRWNFILRRKWK